MRNTLLIGFLFFSYSAFSQTADFSWWNKKHNWDGVTPWSQYIVASPGLMGPNALPVPDVRDAYLEDSTSLLMRYDQHGGMGDNTQNIFTQVYVNVLPKRVSFVAWVVPIEKYETDSATRDQRFAREYSGKGIAGGDVYFSSLINILKERKYIPATTFECIVKTASGTNLANARYTDTPGYIFTVHTSKKIYAKNNYRYTVNFNTGFFSWQTNKDLHRQNDALVYGGNLSMLHPKFSFTAGLKGYCGYIKDGDRPNVIFLQGTKNYGQIKLLLTLSYGLTDYPYQSVLFGVAYYPHKIIEQLKKY